MTIAGVVPPRIAGLHADPLLTRLPDDIPDWAAWLSGEEGAVAETLRRMTHTGRPLGSAGFLARLEAVMGRTVTPGKRGLKPKMTPVTNGAIGS